MPPPDSTPEPTPPVNLHPHRPRPPSTRGDIRLSCRLCGWGGACGLPGRTAGVPGPGSRSPRSCCSWWPGSAVVVGWCTEERVVVGSCCLLPACTTQRGSGCEDYYPLLGTPQPPANAIRPGVGHPGSGPGRSLETNVRPVTILFPKDATTATTNRRDRRTREHQPREHRTRPTHTNDTRAGYPLEVALLLDV